MSIILLTFDPHRDLEAWGDHVSLEQGQEPEEALCITRKRNPTLDPPCYVIPLDNLFKFCAPANAHEEFALVESCIEIAKVLGCPTDKRSLSRISMFVQDNIDKVTELKPFQGKGRVIGEAEGTLNGRSFSSEVRAY